ncbi:hypothetical protein [Falsiroseomonas sp.]|uniref:hypothetical protein n=1 Tax=Falsiroseomonas sp. TaxID=2870721 RepID=UPI0034A502E5
MDEPWQPNEAARWLAEAMETGSPLAPLPPGMAPRSMAEAEEVAAATLEALEIPPCGLRLLLRPGAAPLAGPMLEGRLVPAGRTVALGMLRHPQASAAVVGVLAEPLDPDSDAPPVFARLHPALDLSATRFTDAPADDITLTADLARLGLVVVGKGKAVAPGAVRVALGAKGGRSKGAETDLAAAFAEAAAAARGWGGLPAGALLVVAGLSPSVQPGGTLRAALGALGAVEASFS